jgi:hypothetical protein
MAASQDLSRSRSGRGQVKGQLTERGYDRVQWVTSRIRGVVNR